MSERITNLILLCGCLVALGYNVAQRAPLGWGGILFHAACGVGLTFVIASIALNPRRVTNG